MIEKKEYRMANICSFVMLLKGEKEDMLAFCNALQQTGNIWMGRGAEIDIFTQSDNSLLINGQTKWSIASSLIDNAKDMRKQAETGEGCWYGIKKDDPREFITLWEACEKFNVNMEVFSEEPGIGFAEHMAYENGDFLEEWTRYSEYYFNEYDDKESAETDLGIKISNEEWAEGFCSRGGYKNMEFNIETPDEYER